jgi:hypothetical protein
VIAVVLSGKGNAATMHRFGDTVIACGTETSTTPGMPQAAINGVDVIDQVVVLNDLVALLITLTHCTRAYGAPRVTAELQQAGQSVNHQRVARVMHRFGAQGLLLRRRQQRGRCGWYDGPSRTSAASTGRSAVRRVVRKSQVAHYRSHEHGGGDAVWVQKCGPLDQRPGQSGGGWR